MKTFTITYRMHYVTGPYVGIVVAQSLPATADSLSLHLQALNSRTPANPGKSFDGNEYYVTDIVVKEKSR